MDFTMILIWAAVGAICYAVAERKNRSPVIWGAMGFLFSFIALIVLLILPAIPEESNVGKIFPKDE